MHVRDVSCSRGRGAAHAAVLQRLSLSFEPGVLTAVTGRSGVGKTTLLELIACLRKPDSGQIVLDDRSLGRLGPEQLAELRRERIGYLPQEPAPIGFLTALENVTLALSLRDCPALGSDRASRRGARAGRPCGPRTPARLAPVGRRVAAGRAGSGRSRARAVC